MAYTRDSIAKLKESINIVDVVSHALPLKKAGANYKGLCPFHAEKTPSFVVNERLQFFTCFGCGAKGDVIEFVQRYYRLDFTEALDKLAEEYHIRLEKEGGRTEDLRPFYEANREAARFFYRAFTEQNNQAYQYMRKRGIDPRTLKKFGIGYADEGWDSLTTYMESRGYGRELLLELGLAVERNGKVYDKFRHRVIFPIINTRGKIIGFGGRTLETDGIPKYLNSPESRVFQKKNNLYGLNFAREEVGRKGFCLLVEGYMDTISLYQGGIQNVVASLGTSLTQNQAGLIKRYAKDVVLSYDADAAGAKAALRGMDLLREEGLRVRVMHVTDGKDPDEFIRKEGRKAFEELMTRALPYAEYKIRAACQGLDFDDEEQKITGIKKVVAILRTLDPIERDVYTRKAAKDFAVSEEALRRESQVQGPDQAQPRRRKSSEDNRERLSGIERDLLRLISRNEAFAERIAEVGEELLFTTKGGRRLFRLLREAIAEGNFHLRDFLDEQEDEDRDRMLEVLETIPATGDEETIFVDCQKRARLTRLAAEQRELLSLISMSQGTADAKTEANLMRRLREVQGEMAEERMRK